MNKKFLGGILSLGALAMFAGATMSPTHVSAEPVNIALAAHGAFSSESTPGHSGAKGNFIHIFSADILNNNPCGINFIIQCAAEKPLPSSAQAENLW